jgi:hypothetical protein
LVLNLLAFVSTRRSKLDCGYQKSLKGKGRACLGDRTTDARINFEQPARVSPSTPALWPHQVRRRDSGVRDRCIHGPTTNTSFDRRQEIGTRRSRFDISDNEQNLYGITRGHGDLGGLLTV